MPIASAAPTVSPERVEALSVQLYEPPTLAEAGANCSVSAPSDLGSTSYQKLNSVKVVARKIAGRAEPSVLVVWQDDKEEVASALVSAEGRPIAASRGIRLPGASLFEAASQPDGTVVLMANSPCTVHGHDDCAFARALTSRGSPLGGIAQVTVGPSMNPVGELVPSARGAMTLAILDYPQYRLSVVRATPRRDGAGAPTGVDLSVAELAAPPDRWWSRSRWLDATADGRYRALALDDKGGLHLYLEGESPKPIAFPPGLKKPRTVVWPGRSGDAWVAFVAEDRAQTEATALLRVDGAGGVASVKPASGYIANPDLDWISASTFDWDESRGKKLLLDRAHGFSGLVGARIATSSHPIPSDVAWIGDRYVVAYGERLGERYAVRMVTVRCDPWLTTP